MNAHNDDDLPATCPICEDASRPVMVVTFTDPYDGESFIDTRCFPCSRIDTAEADRAMDRAWYEALKFLRAGS